MNCTDQQYTRMMIVLDDIQRKMDMVFHGLVSSNSYQYYEEFYDRHGKRVTLRFPFGWQIINKENTSDSSLYFLEPK